MALMILPVLGDAQQLDDTCTVSILNRTVQAQADGTWVLPNVPATLGQVRARATCVEDGITRSGQSDYFTLPPDGSITLPPIILDAADPIAESIVITAPNVDLTTDLPSTQLAVEATYPDGTTADITLASTGTNYTSSNPGIASISADGLVTAQTSGAVLVSAMNEGALAVIQLQVFLSGDTDGDGIPDDIEIALGLDPNDPIDGLEDADGDGLENGAEFLLGTNILDPDTDGDGILDGEEVREGADGFITSALLADTDGDGLRDGLEISLGSDPTDANSSNLADALESLIVTPSDLVIIFNTLTGEGSEQLSVTGNLIDGTTIDLTSTAKGTNYVSDDLTVCNFGSPDGRVFAGAEGICTITASNSGFSAEATATVTSFSPQGVSFVELPGYANNVDVLADYAFVAAGPDGLHVVDVANKDAPSLITTLPLDGNANDVRVQGNTVYVAGGSAGLHIVDVTDPAIPSLILTVDTPGDAIDVVVSGASAFVADGTAGLQIISVATPADASIIGSVDTEGVANGLDVSGTTVLMSNQESPVSIIDVTNPATPAELATLAMEAGLSTFDVAMLPSIAYVSTADGIKVIDLGIPSTPVLVGTVGVGVWMLDIIMSPGSDLAFTTQVRPDTPMPIFGVQTPLAPVSLGDILFSELAGAGSGDGVGLAADAEHVYMTATRGFEARAKPGDTGATRLFIGRYLLLGDTANQAPVVTITSPAANAEFVEGETILVVAEATDDVAVATVNFFVDGAPVFSDATAPYEYAFAAPAANSLTISATAIDLGNNVGFSEEVIVSIASDPGTSVAGTAVNVDGSPLAGALVTCNGVAAFSEADGSFTIDDVPTIDGIVECRLTYTTPTGELLFSELLSFDAVRGGITDVGALQLSQDLLYPAENFTLQYSIEGENRTCCEVVRVVDFDGDGHVDIVGADTKSSGFPSINTDMAILLSRGLGNGKFDQPTLLQYSPDVSARISTRSLAVADLNDDNLFDVATSHLDGSINVLLGMSDGLLAAPFNLDAGGGAAYDVTAVDVNNDGLPDLVTANDATEDVSVLINQGAAVFSATALYPIAEVGSNVDLRAIAAADFNRDGLNDLVAMGNNVDTFFVLTNIGNGVFSKTADIVSGVAPNDIIAVDLNADEWPDIASADFLGDGISVVLNDGTGGFAAVELLFAGNRSRPFTLDVGDVNGDGQVDIVSNSNSAENDSVSLFLGTGDGVFQLAGYFTAGAPSGQVFVSDLTGDGLDDVLKTTGFSVGVLHGDAHDLLAAPGRYPAGDLPLAVEIADWNQDGHVDVLIANFFSCPSPCSVVDDATVSVLNGNGDGTFEPEQRIATTFDEANALVVADFNEDDVPDLVVSHGSGSARDEFNEVALLLGSGGGSVSAPQILPVGNSPAHIVAIDVDGNGDLDLVTANGGGTFSNGGSDDLSILLGRGDGTFDPETRVPMGTAPIWVALADLDDDGHLDVVSANHNSDDISIRYGEGGASFGPEVRIAVGDPTRDDRGGDDTAPSSVVVADVNEDGWLDIVVTLFLSDEIAILFGDANGAFVERSSINLVSSSFPESLNVVDINLDGHLDLATTLGWDIGVHLGRGDGTFEPVREFVVGGSFQGALKVADLNADGLPDMVARRSIGDLPEWISVLLHR